MRKIFAFCCMLISLAACGQTGALKIEKVYHISGTGGWDYIALNGGKIYVAHGSQVNVLSEADGDSVGVIRNTNGVHGIAFDNDLNRGYTSNGKSNNVTVFDLHNLGTIAQIQTGENPDAIIFEPYTKTIITCNGRSKDLSLIDPATNAVTATITVGGKPETAVSDNNGKLFVNIEDKSEIAAVDLKARSVTNRWPLSAEDPTGLAYDKNTKRLFAGCDRYLVVVNAETGKIVDKLPIGDGCDGVVFDAKNNIIFTSNGQSGTITAVKENSADKFSVLGNYATKRGARTITMDEQSGELFLPTTEFDASNMQNGRPSIIPGSFEVLVVKADKR